MTDGHGIAAIIGAAGGAVVTFIGAWFRQRRLSARSKNISMVDNYQTLYVELRKEIGRIREEQIEERKQWSNERQSFNEKIDKLQEIIRTQDKASHAKDIEVTELRGKVELLTTQLEIYKDAHIAAKNVTIKT